MSDGADGAPPALLVMEGINKSFAGVQALSEARFEVRAGEIHALLGENGAGKSTLVRILSAAHQMDSGKIRWRGQPIEIRKFADAERLGIRLIYQQLSVIEHLTVEQNLTLGRERSRATFIDRAEGRRRATEALARLGISLELGATVGSLRVAERQLIEIARAMTGAVHLLIMDEPTASLGEREVERLFTVARSLRDQGMAIVFISHKLEEVGRVADRITILRDGHTVDTMSAAGMTEDDLIAMMVGRRLGHDIARESHATDEVVLEVDSVSSDTGLHNVSISVRRGEVLGVYGLLGSGRTELVRAIFGADPLRSGEVRVFSKPARFRSPVDARRRGIGLIPEDRSQASFPLLSVAENLTAASGDLVSTYGWLHVSRARRMAQKANDSLRVRTPSIDEPMARLSGGNQQKVIVGRWLMREAPILLLDDPTVGIDVGAKDELYRLITAMTAQGATLILTSSELPELLALSDRVVVLHHGRVAGVLERDELTQENVLQLAITGRSAAVRAAAEA